MKIILCFIVSLFIPLLTHPSEISGIILNQDSLPIADVQVQILNTIYVDISDSTGQFKIRNLPDGQYQISFNHISYLKKILEPVQIQAGERLNIGTIMLQQFIHRT